MICEGVSLGVLGAGGELDGGGVRVEERADGRDMGTVVFPAAGLKIFLTASAEERAERRYKQLIAKGESVSLPRLLADIQERDERDSQREVSPLVPAEDAIVIDSTATPIAAVFEQVMLKVKEKGLN